MPPRAVPAVTRAVAILRLLGRSKTPLGMKAIAQQLDLERDFQRELGRSEDFREGVLAFLGKRKPAFKGK